MERGVFTFGEEPAGRLYLALLDASVAHCESMLLVQRASIGIGHRAKSLIERLAPWLLEESQRSEWPGTKLHGDRALVRIFSLNRDSAEVLRSSAKRLYEWKQPALLEDLCLLRPSGEPWLVSIAHERDAYLRISEDERDRLVDAIPDLGVILRYT